MQALADFEVQIVLIKEEKKELIIQHDLEICNCLKADVIYGKITAQSAQLRTWESALRSV